MNILRRKTPNLQEKDINVKTALHILNDLKPSGMEKMLECSMNEWGKNNWEIVILGSGKNHTFANNLKDAGYEIILIENMKSLAGMLQFIKLVFSRNFDLFHNHSEALHGPISIILKFIRPRVPIIRTIHNCFIFSGKDFIRRNIQNKIEAFAGTQLVSCSVDVKHNESTLWKRNTKLIENWVDTETISTYKNQKPTKSFSETPVYTIVGNCSAIKNHEFALQILNEFDGFELYHLGEQSKISELEKRYLDELNKRFILKANGPSNEVLSIFKSSDVHIICSTHEGWGLVIAESILLGIETWVREVPGTNWSVGLPGVKTFQTQSELRLLIQNFQELKSRKQRTATTDFVDVYRFSAERGVGEYTNLYNECLTRSSCDFTH
jgi:hypothetical protein